MTDDGRRLSDAEKRAWLNEKGNRRTGPHALTRKIMHWLYCARCGLVALKNDATRKALKAPCAWEE